MHKYKPQQSHVKVVYQMYMFQTEQVVIYRTSCTNRKMRKNRQLLINTSARISLPVLSTFETFLPCWMRRTSLHQTEWHGDRPGASGSFHTKTDTKYICLYLAYRQI